MLRQFKLKMGQTFGHNTDGSLAEFEYAPILFVRPQGESHTLVALSRGDWVDLGSPEEIIVTVEEVTTN